MKKYGFGIDVGGTAIKMGLFTTDGELIEKWEIKTNKEDQGSRIFDDIAEQIDEKLSERNISKSEVAGIGIGVPGPVQADGTVVKCVNVGWGILNVEQELATRTGLTVKAGNKTIGTGIASTNRQYSIRIAKQNKGTKIEVSNTDTNKNIFNRTVKIVK